MEIRKQLLTILLGGFLLTGILAGCSSSTSSPAASNQTSADSNSIKKSKHRIVLYPKRIDPLAEPTELDGNEVGLTSLTLAEQHNGWKLLFNGKDFNGWKGFNSDTIGSAWKIKNGLLKLDLSDRDTWKSNHGGDLCSQHAHGNFDLRLDYRTYPNTNSGVLIRVQEGKKWQFPYDTGFEMQILDDNANPDKPAANHRSASMFGLFAAPIDVAKGPRKWNHLLIKAHGTHIQYFLNEKKTVDIVIGSSQWKENIAKSNFSKKPGFGLNKSGKIDFQEYGSSVDFRNIKIHDLESYNQKK